MQKPDFGNDPRRVRWTDERVAYVRHCAETLRWPARKIGKDVGLATFRINAICARKKIQLQGQAGRPPALDVVHHVPIAEKHLPLLAKIATDLKLKPRDCAAQLVDALFEQGEAFCRNMLT